MAPEPVGFWTIVAGVLGLIGTLAGGYGAVRSFTLARSIDARLREDERILAGPVQQPDLLHPDHSRCLISVHLVNRSKRSVAVTRVLVFNPAGSPIEVTWSGGIDHIGSPRGVTGGPLLIDPQCTLFIRRDDGKVFADETVVKIFHGFAGSPLVLTYRLHGGWLDWVEQ